MRHTLAFLLLVALFFPLQSAHAQSTVEVADLLVSYRFGEQFNIQARLNAPAAITDATILFRAVGETGTRSEHLSVDPDGRINYTYAMSQGPLRSFARVDFWFHATLQTGEQVDTSQFYFNYSDDRFPWQTVEGNGVRVHWYAGDADFGRQALDAAVAGLQKTGQMLSVSPRSPIDIYIYSIAADLQSALEIGGETWSGGHASPDLNVALVAIAPGLDQGTAIDRKIPHELAHILTYQVAGQHYDALPVWLREGIATVAESPNPDNPQMLSQALAQQTLIPIVDLCGSFPPENARAVLAYAESQSFVNFILGRYGNSGLLNLIGAYADGLDCEQGPIRALDMPLTQLEGEWRRSLRSGGASVSPVLDDLLPYLAMLAVILFVPLFLALIIRRTPYARHSLGQK